MTLEQVAEAIMESAKEELDCVMCGVPTRERAFTVVEPDDNGESSVFIFALCECHPANDATQMLVDAMIDAGVVNIRRLGDESCERQL